MTNVAIDWTRCQAHGLCVEIWPEMFSRDDWGYPMIRRRPIKDSELASARRAVALCPALALRLVTDGGR